MKDAEKSCTLCFPVGYVMFSDWFLWDTVFFLYDPAGYRDFPCFFRHPEVIGNERFRYGKNPTGILLPRSGYFSGRFRCNPGWKRRECTGIDTVSSRFLQDPDAGTIDLGWVIHYIIYRHLDAPQKENKVELKLQPLIIISDWYRLNLQITDSENSSFIARTGVVLTKFGTIDTSLHRTARTFYLQAKDADKEEEQYADYDDATYLK